MPVDTTEPEWLRTARERGLILAEGRPVSKTGIPATGSGDAGASPARPSRKPRTRTATARPDPAPRQTWAIEFVVDYSPKNESNIGGGLRAKLGRKAAAKRATDAAIPPVLGLMPLPVLVTLTRIGGAKRMDDDGLATSMKFVRDRIAAALGVDDGDVGKVRFRCRQRPGWGRARVLVRVESR